MPRLLRLTTAFAAACTLLLALPVALGDWSYADDHVDCTVSGTCADASMSCLYDSYDGIDYCVAWDFTVSGCTTFCDGICNCDCGDVDPDCESNKCEPGSWYCDPVYGECITCDTCDADEECLWDPNHGPICTRWTCDPGQYGYANIDDDGCDCGCGSPDPDCEHTFCSGNDYECRFGQCVYCEETCDSGEQCLFNPMTRESSCEEWTYPTSASPDYNAYGGWDGCQCGYGSYDPDCYLQDCVDGDPNCNIYGHCDMCDPEDSTTCVGDCLYNTLFLRYDCVDDWSASCDTSSYAAMDGCDCNCGTDPDCWFEDCNEDGVYGYLCNDLGECDECSDALPCDADELCVFDSRAERHVCVLWTCAVDEYDGADGCDCGCGSFDPDCYFDRCEPGTPLCNEHGHCYDCGESGCGTLECLYNRYTHSGECVDWTCPPDEYASRDGCDCNCGAYDPDCDYEDCDPEDEFCTGFGWCFECLDDCATGETCVFDPFLGPICAAWTCSSHQYYWDSNCDCNCGVADPTCEDISCVPSTTDYCNGYSGECYDPTVECTCSGTDKCVPVDSTDYICVEWDCPESYYNSDDGCDCDCGSYDPDCDDQECKEGADLCNVLGECYACAEECETGEMCLYNQYTDQADCWYWADSCDASDFADGNICDCQCGEFDPDCAQPNMDCDFYSMENCNIENECFYCEEECLSGEVCLFDYRTETASCVPWTCDRIFYGSHDGCDCECGSPDPDCNDRLNNLNDPPELFNCRRDDTWCSPSGYCYECPEEGCGDNEICSEGLCIPWYCDPDYYYADKICDCNCGSYDPDCLLAGNDIAAKDARDVVPCIELFESCPDAVSSLDGTCAYCTPECREGSSCVYYEDEIGICECLDECDTDVGNSLYCGFPYDDPCGNIVCAGDYCPNDAYCSWEYSPFWWEQFFNDEEYVEYCECDTICDQPEDHPCSIEYYDDCGIYCGIGTSCPDDQYCGFYGCVDWQCDPTYYGTDDGCDCECGGWDPDCTHMNFVFHGELYNCDRDDSYCNTEGHCFACASDCDEDEFCWDTDNDGIGECVTWNCPPWFFLDGKCDCGCGSPDPDCLTRGTDVVRGCPEHDDWCNENGECFHCDDGCPAGAFCVDYDADTVGECFCPLSCDTDPYNGHTCNEIYTDPCGVEDCPQLGMYCPTGSSCLYTGAEYECVCDDSCSNYLSGYCSEYVYNDCGEFCFVGNDCDNPYYYCSGSCICDEELAAIDCTDTYLLTKYCGDITYNGCGELCETVGQYCPTDYTCKYEEFYGYECYCDYECDDPSIHPCGKMYLDPCGDSCPELGTACPAKYTCEDEACVCSEDCADPYEIECGTEYHDSCNVLCPSLGLKCEDGYVCNSDSYECECENACADPRDMPCGDNFTDTCGNSCEMTGLWCPLSHFCDTDIWDCACDYPCPPPSAQFCGTALFDGCHVACNTTGTLCYPGHVCENETCVCEDKCVSSDEYICGEPYENECHEDCGTGTYCGENEKYVCDEGRCVCAMSCPLPEEVPCGAKYADGCNQPCYGMIGTMCPEDNMCLNEHCVPWTCDPEWLGTHDGCDCECGGLDPDCHDPHEALWHCADGADGCNMEAHCYDCDPDCGPGYKCMDLENTGVGTCMCQIHPQCAHPDRFPCGSPIYDGCGDLCPLGSHCDDGYECVDDNCECERPCAKIEDVPCGEPVLNGCGEEICGGATGSKCQSGYTCEADNMCHCDNSCDNFDTDDYTCGAKIYNGCHELCSVTGTYCENPLKYVCDDNLCVCSVPCPEPEDVPCGAPFTNGCGVHCDGVGSMCDEGETCMSPHEGAPLQCVVWTCPPEWYGSGEGCDCECGGVDPDCYDHKQTLWWCEPGADWCNAEGHCYDCDPNCGPGYDCLDIENTGIGECICRIPCEPADELPCGMEHTDGCGNACEPGLRCHEGETCVDGTCECLPCPAASDVPCGFTPRDGCGIPCSYEGTMCPVGDQCIQSQCISWTCDPDYYNANDGCDCECGAYDPDCLNPLDEVWWCPNEDDFCNQDAHCYNCTPACDDEYICIDPEDTGVGMCVCATPCVPPESAPCGPYTNGCDELCPETGRMCDEGYTCHHDTCECNIPCIPTETRTCGFIYLDGCGDECQGTMCQPGFECVDGVCECEQCEPGFVCQDNECVCAKPCAETNTIPCGEPYLDGCMEFCPHEGSWCPAKYTCEEGSCVCAIPCPLPEQRMCGQPYTDGCSGSCEGGIGTMCPTGETCIDGLCYEWTCDPDWYGTHDGCDCECGGVDPDCLDPTQTLWWCPPGADGCNDEAHCYNCTPDCDFDFICVDPESDGVGACVCVEPCDDPADHPCGEEYTDDCGVVCQQNGTACDEGFMCSKGECICATPCDPSSVPCGASFVDACGIPCPTTGTQCNTPDICEYGPGTCTSDVCVYPDSATGTPCDDSNLCTTGDSCAAGICSGVEIECTTPSSQCQELIGECDAKTGECVYDATPGYPCDDEDPCTIDDRCEADLSCVGTWDCICGDGKIDYDEECDGTYHCTNCTCDDGWFPNVNGTNCTQCGNEIVDDGEDCDGGLNCTVNCQCPEGYHGDDSGNCEANGGSENFPDWGVAILVVGSFGAAAGAAAAFAAYTVHNNRQALTGKFKENEFHVLGGVTSSPNPPPRV